MEKRGLEARLREVGLKAGQGIVWGDEMRLGLIGQVRKVWAPRRATVRQAVQFSRQYAYVAVAIDPVTGRLWWAWQASMKGAEMARIWGPAEDPAIAGWVWDGAGGHQGEEMQAVDAPRVAQPPYVPELNPVACFFRELRRAIEGKVYPTLQAKQAALELVLNAWQADPERVRRLCGWKWIRKALKNLSNDMPASPAGPLA